MASKRKILEALTRDRLLEIARHVELSGLTASPKAEIIDSLAGSRRVQADDFLPRFSRDDLKALCQELGVDDSGREKQLLIDRLLGRDGESEAPRANNHPRTAMAKKKPKNGSGDSEGLFVEDYRHKEAKRKNNPPAKIAAEGIVPVMPKVEYTYSPRRPPTLRFDPTGKPDQLPELLEKATKQPLTEDEAKVLAEALRTQQPWLEWASKQESEAKGFAVDPVALLIHERISAQAILKVAARQDVERTLFGDPEQEYHEAVQFYRHDVDWTNRLILGDSVQVMSSLARREDLAGKVQMIYMDPPYGIKYPSNFQPEVGKRDVKDKETHLTRELEMVKAYRDTWHLGIHSYLGYLRDRLIVAKELLADSGSIFIQISDENLHRVRDLLDDVFGTANFVSQIAFATTTGFNTALLASIADHILWYARDIKKAKFHAIYREKEPGEEGAAKYKALAQVSAELHLAFDGEQFATSDQITSQGASTTTAVFEFQGQNFEPPAGMHFKTNVAGLARLSSAGRLKLEGALPRYMRLLSDFAVFPLANIWLDIGGVQSRTEGKVYVVQTATEAIARCMLMTSDPGDLVLDPTCGSGTTAHVAEQWGRRWITIDTSRVSIAVARQRLLTAKFDYYKTKTLNDQTDSNPAQGFIYKTVPHIELGRIAQNASLDPIFSKHEVTLSTALAKANAALSKVSPEGRAKLVAKLAKKASEEGLKSVTFADDRRWLLPGTTEKQLRDALADAFIRAKKKITPKQICGIIDCVPKPAEVGPSSVPKTGIGWEHWQVPFDTDLDWPKELQEAVAAYRKAWRAKMDEVNACIAGNAKQEELVDQPEIERDVVRVSGPFSVESVQPPEISLGDVIGAATLPGEMFDGAPDDLDKTFTGRTFCITQAFFPDQSAWEKLAKALGTVLNEDAFEKLAGTISLPFPAGKHKCVAVKVIDPRGNEVMQVHRLKA